MLATIFQSFQSKIIHPYTIHLRATFHSFSSLSLSLLFSLLSFCHSRVSRNRLQIIRERESGGRARAGQKVVRNRTKSRRGWFGGARYGGRWKRGWVGKREKVGVAARGRVKSTGRLLVLRCIPVSVSL